MKHTDSFDLESTLKIPKKDLAAMLKSMIFSNEIARAADRGVKTISYHSNPEASPHPFPSRGKGKDVKYLLDLNEVCGIVM